MLWKKPEKKRRVLTAVQETKVRAEARADAEQRIVFLLKDVGVNPILIQGVFLTLGFQKEESKEKGVTP